jgi:pimeloyl-ACP methyl ester carboxylesterase
VTRPPPGAAGPGVERTVRLGAHGSTVVLDVAGPEGAPAVMLLHGLGATARLNWGRCFRPLAERFRVLSLDQRGHGRGLRTRRFRLEECADDAAEAAEALGVRRFVAVGYSMGGPVAALAWRRHPERVCGLVLCATARHFTSRGAARIARVTLPAAAAAARLLTGTVHRRLVQRLLVQIEHPALRDRIRDELLGHEPATVIQAAEALTRFSSHDWIGDVDVPTAVVVTTEDELVPAVRQRKLARSIPGAEVFEVAGDHDACVRSADFPPTLVRACLAVTRCAAPAARTRG